MKSALFDLDDTLLDRTGSLRDFVLWQAKGMLRSDISDPNYFVALDQHGMVWKDKVYDSIIKEFNITA